MCFLYDEIKKNEIKINSEEDNQNKKSGKKELFNKESDLIKNIVKKRKNLLIKCGILINFSQLKTIYKLHKDDDE